MGLVISKCIAEFEMQVHLDHQIIFIYLAEPFTILEGYRSRTSAQEGGVDTHSPQWFQTFGMPRMW